MSRSNTVFPRSRTVTRTPNLSVPPAKVLQPTVSRILPRQLSIQPQYGDIIGNVSVIPEDFLVFGGIPVLAHTLVDNVSMHFGERMTSLRLETGHNILGTVLQYLDANPAATPRHLGAFSFLVTRNTHMYLDDGTHFCARHREFLGVYASFGGNMKAATTYRGEIKLSALSALRSRDVRPQRFSEEMLSLVDEGVAFYDLPTPQGDDFLKMSPNVLLEYISAGIGPRMLLDVNAEVTDDMVPEIIACCWKEPTMAPYIHFFDQIRKRLSYTALDFLCVNDIAVLTHDTVLLDAIEQYGESFRLAYLTRPQLDQVLGLPSDIGLSDTVRTMLIKKLMTDNEGFSEKHISPAAVKQYAARIAELYITQRKTLAEMSLGMPCTVRRLTKPGKVYCCADIFTYCTVGEECTMYVVSTDRLKELSMGVGESVDDAVEWSAIERWNHAEDTDLLPTFDVLDRLDIVTHGSTSLTASLPR